MANPKETESTISFPLDLGLDTTSLPQSVQPIGPTPALTLSENTRLAVVRGVPTKAPGVVDTTSLGSSYPSGGLVPVGQGESTVQYLHPAKGSQRVIAGDITDLKGTVNASTHTYWPAEVTSAYSVPSSSYVPAASVYDPDAQRTWYLTPARHEGDDAALYISCIGAQGEVLVTPTQISIATSVRPDEAYTFFALTYHGETNGVIAWYRDPVSGGTASTTIRAKKIHLSGLTLTVSSAYLIYTPLEAEASQVAISSDSNDYAYLATISTHTLGTLSIHKVAVSSMMVSTLDLASFTATACTLSIKHQVVGEQEHLLISSARQAGNARAIDYNPVVMTPRWPGVVTLVGNASLPVTGLYVDPTASYAVIGIWNDAGSITTPTAGGTVFHWLLLSDGTPITTVVAPFVAPVGHIQQLKLSATENYPLLSTQRLYDIAADPTDNGYVLDPSIEVYRLNKNSSLTPVGRLGVDSALRANLAQGGVPLWCTSGCGHIQGSRYTVTYLEDGDTTLADGRVCRSATLDFAPRQPRYTHTPTGAALIAAALPAQWDGVETTELLPLAQPYISVATSGGAGTALATGTYRYAAVYMWTDRNGVVHRSAPSTVQTISGAGMQPVITVTQPVGMRDGILHQRVETIVYASVMDGTVLYAQEFAGLSETDYFLEWDNVSSAVVSIRNPPIYSDGVPGSSALIAQHPPAAYDMKVINDRCWIIDAEKRNKVWPSKTSEISFLAPIAYEWSSDLAVYFPMEAGELVAIEEYNGYPLFLSSTGAWVIAGDGPNNALNGATFASPQQIGVRPCTDGRSAIRTPVGVMYMSGARFVLLAGGQERVVDQVDASVLGSVISCMVLRDAQEVLWVGSTGVTLVYSYSLNKWSQWSTIPTSDLVTYIPTSQDLLTYVSGTLSLIDTSTPSTTAQMRFTTGYVTPTGNPHDDVVLHDVILQARSLGVHGVTITLTPEYGAGAPVVKTFSAAEITSYTVGNQYTLACSFNTHSMRSFKIDIQETGSTGPGMQPVSCSALVTISSGRIKRDAIKLRK